MKFQLPGAGEWRCGESSTPLYEAGFEANFLASVSGGIGVVLPIAAPALARLWCRFRRVAPGVRWNLVPVVLIAVVADGTAGTAFDRFSTLDEFLRRRRLARDIGHAMFGDAAKNGGYNLTAEVAIGALVIHVKLASHLTGTTFVKTSFERHGVLGLS